MKNNSIIYQIFPRTATKDGTIKAATKLLDHIADLGVDIVYLSPFYEMDDDPREEFWSDRQKASGLGNPKNPYRMNDYFKLDEEYGTDEDLKDFVYEAHKLGLKVMFDLVYFHCGPRAKLIDINKDFIKRLPDGTPDNGDWHFPKLNFDCPELCEYLWENMEYWVKNFDIDGYRCDVGDRVPLEFWREGVRRVKDIKPDFIMLNEGRKDEWIESGVFDANYCYWGFERIFDLGEKNINKNLKAIKHINKQTMCFENHDSASDEYENRYERKFGKNVCDAMLVVTFTCGCVPFIYNGNEIADSCRHSLWNNRFYGKNLCVDWSEALTKDGKNRTALVKSLIKIYHNISAINIGDIKVLTESADFTAYKKTHGDREVLVIANMTKDIQTVSLNGENLSDYQTLLSARNIIDNNVVTLSDGGYLVLYK